MRSSSSPKEGALGTAAVQLAKAFGARVTAVCSTVNIELVTELGADIVIDYTEQDFTENHDRYDIIYDTVGKRSYRQCKKALTKSGMYLAPVLSIPLLFQMLWTKIVGRKRARFDATGIRPASDLRAFLSQLIAMAEDGTLRGVVDAAWDFSDDVVQQGDFLELRIPRSEIGTPSRVSVHVNVINETNGVESSFPALPTDSFSDGYDPDYTKYYDFDLQGIASPASHSSLP